MSSRPRVVVIGGGIAGLSAALNLQNSKEVDVTILEASSRIGGRIHTSTINNEVVELGAGWIHDSTSNPLYDAAREINVVLSKGFNCDASEFGSVTFYTLGQANELPTKLANEVYEAYEKIYDDCKTTASELNESLGLGIYYGNKFEHYLENNAEHSSLKRSLFEWIMRNECHSSGVKSLENVDIKSSPEYSVDEKDSFTLPHGYNKLLERIFEDLDEETVRFNHEVVSIKWKPKAEETSSSVVSITCSNGEIFTAEHVIVTLPLGVLKSRHEVIFNPPLPQIKKDAINRLGYGTINRIYLVFEKAFWSNEIKGMGLLWTNLDSNNWPSWVKELYIFYPTHKGSNVLVTWLSGEAAIQIESISDQEIAHECTRVLKAFTGLKEIPGIKEVMKTKWHSNKLSRGSYTYIPRYSGGADIDILASPLPHLEGEAQGNVPCKILFAGEATNRSAYATTHGAYISGVREAKRILDYRNFKGVN
ncbi:spermine oxidase [Nematostella vectensis]|uniref:spermine oxidase n=1 Tax=Nematostella vectensis TaxID=45351 RepID=UPI0020777F02|nr:spermine oxidase [Nematostella vectensis]